MKKAMTTRTLPATVTAEITEQKIKAWDQC
jgi:hypothetical protein